MSPRRWILSCLRAVPPLSRRVCSLTMLLIITYIQRAWMVRSCRSLVAARTSVLAALVVRGRVRLWCVDR